MEDRGERVEGMLNDETVVNVHLPAPKMRYAISKPEPLKPWSPNPIPIPWLASLRATCKVMKVYLDLGLIFLLMYPATRTKKRIEYSARKTADEMTSELRGIFLMIECCYGDEKEGER